MTVSLSQTLLLVLAEHSCLFTVAYTEPFIWANPVIASLPWGHLPGECHYPFFLTTTHFLTNWVVHKSCVDRENKTSRLVPLGLKVLDSLFYSLPESNKSSSIGGFNSHVINYLGKIQHYPWKANLIKELMDITPLRQMKLILMEIMSPWQIIVRMQ